MKTITSIIASCSMAVALFGVSSLQAAVILPGVGTLDIDFRDTGVWGGANGVNSFSVGGITANVVKPTSASLSQTESAGLGVDSRGAGDTANEIDTSEGLELLFLSGSGNGLSGVWLTNLFPDELADSRPKKDTAVVTLTLLDSTTLEFVAPGNQTDGVFFLDFGGNRNVSKVLFDNKTNAPQQGLSDYSVVGFSVPEGGSTLLVLGMALVGLAGVTSYQRRLAM